MSNNMEIEIVVDEDWRTNPSPTRHATDKSLPRRRVVDADEDGFYNTKCRIKTPKRAIGRAGSSSGTVIGDSTVDTIDRQTDRQTEGKTDKNSDCSWK